MRVRLNNLKITEVEGKYGPQIRINFKQILTEGHRWVSGFINKEIFDDSWKEGAEKDLEIYQKGDFWNFKLADSGKKNTTKSVMNSSQHEEIMDALRKLYIKIDEVHKQVMQDREPGLFDDPTP
jgi:hypothetical protein